MQVDYLQINYNSSFVQILNSMILNWNFKPDKTHFSYWVVKPILLFILPFSNNTDISLQRCKYRNYALEKLSREQINVKINYSGF